MTRRRPPVTVLGEVAYDRGVTPYEGLGEPKPGGGPQHGATIPLGVHYWSNWQRPLDDSRVTITLLKGGREREWVEAFVALHREACASLLGGPGSRNRVALRRKFREVDDFVLQRFDEVGPKIAYQYVCGLYSVLKPLMDEEDDDTQFLLQQRWEDWVWMRYGRQFGSPENPREEVWLP